MTLVKSLESDIQNITDLDLTRKIIGSASDDNIV